MLKIISSVAATALTVGGAGYSYVTKVQTDLNTERDQNKILIQENANQKQKLVSQDLAIDEVIRKLQLAKSDSHG
jgi:hypothetical protein